VEASVNVFRDRSAWENAVGNAFYEEVFDDDLLPSGVSVVSDNGSINTGNGTWLDRVNDSQVTTWQFATPLYGFGAEWDLVGPTGIRLSVGGQPAPQEIPRGTKGEFFGIISDESFQDVLVAGGTQGNGNETYTMDNMVYSSTPSIGPLLATAEQFLGPAPPPLSSSPVYNNTANFTNYFYPISDGEILGDTVDLASGPRGMTEISLLIGANPGGGPGTADTTISVHGGDDPTDPLLFTTTLADQNYAVGFNTVTVHTPYVTLPDTITWTVAFSNRVDAGELGPLIYDPPTVGSSDDYFWLNGATLWFGGDPVANFGAEIKAVVPEPSTFLIWSLLAALGIGCGRWRRRR
jgi:hypothetical protein